MNLTKCRLHVLSYSMCLVEKLQQKAEDSGVFDLDASPATEELDSRSVISLHRALSLRVTVLSGNEERFCRECHREVGDKEMWSTRGISFLANGGWIHVTLHKQRGLEGDEEADHGNMKEKVYVSIGKTWGDNGCRPQNLLPVELQLVDEVIWWLVECLLGIALQRACCC